MGTMEKGWGVGVVRKSWKLSDRSSHFPQPPLLHWQLAESWKEPKGGRDFAPISPLGRGGVVAQCSFCNRGPFSDVSQPPLKCCCPRGPSWEGTAEIDWRSRTSRRLYPAFFPRSSRAPPPPTTIGGTWPRAPTE